MSTNLEDQNAFDELINGNDSLEDKSKSPALSSRKGSKLNLFGGGNDEEKALKKQIKAAAKAAKEEEKKKRKAAEAEEKALVSQHLKELSEEIKKQAAENRRLEAENKKTLEKYKKEVKSSPSSSPSISRRNSFSLGRPSDSQELALASVVAYDTKSVGESELFKPSNKTSLKSVLEKDDTSAAAPTSSSASTDNTSTASNSSSATTSTTPVRKFNSGCWTSIQYGAFSGNITPSNTTINSSFVYDTTSQSLVTKVEGLYRIKYILSNILVSSEASVKLLINNVLVKDIITTYSNYRSLISSQTGEVVVELAVGDVITLNLPDAVTFGQSDQVKQSLIITSVQ